MIASPLVVAVICLVISAAVAVNKKSNYDQLPYIKCDVCGHVIDTLHHTLSEKRMNAPYNKLEEIIIVDTIDNICKPSTRDGEWIKTMDIVHRKEPGGTFLDLETPGGSSKCNNECNAIVKSCNDLIEEEIDRDDLSTMLYKNKMTAEEMKNKVCSSMTSRCTKPKRPLTKKVLDEQFTGMSEKDMEMERIMAEMQASGIGGSMYGRDDIAKMAEMDGDDYEDNDGGVQF